MDAIRNISVLIFSAVLFINGTGIIINKHFCGGDLKAQAFYIPAQKCSHADISNKKTCHKKESQPDRNNSNPDCEKNCCDNSSQYFESDLDIQDIQIEKLNINKTFVVAYISSYFNYPHHNFDEKATEYLNIKPPLLLKDLEILYQSFLC